MGVLEVFVRVAMRDAPYSVEAANRMSMVSDSFRAHGDGDRVRISSERSEAEAEHCWRVMLLNERLVAEAKAGRDGVLASLVA